MNQVLVLSYPQETAKLADDLLVVSNVPIGLNAATEVQELVKRFGSFKRTLVLNHRVSSVLCPSGADSWSTDCIGCQVVAFG